MDEIESQLVAQAATGDRGAIQRLLTRHHNRLVATIEQRLPADLRGAVSPEDICQDAYISVYQQVTSLRDHSAPAFRGWLQAIVERKLIDAIRTWRAQKRGGGRRAEQNCVAAEVSSVIDLLDMAAVYRHTPSRSVARRELIEGVDAAMDELNADYQQALRLHYVEGLSVAETAARMGRSDGAVLMLCNRALRQLAKTIGDPGRFLSHDA